MSEGRNGGAGPAGWPAGDGEMAALIRAYDRAATSLGPIEVWPQGLRTAVDICLDSGFASFVWWGPDLIQFYNDAALPIVRAKHPASFAVPAKEAWSDVWEVIGLLAERVVETGEPVLGEDMPMVPERGGLMEVAYFTFSYNALRDETGSIAGMLATAIETTEKVREAARRRESEERQAFLLELNDAIEPLSSPVGIQGDRAGAGRGRQGGESREGGLAGGKGWPEDLGKRDRHRRARRGRRAHRVRQDKPRPHRAPGTGGRRRGPGRASLRRWRRPRRGSA